MHRNILLKEADNLAEKIWDFKKRIKVPFINRLFWEIDNAMQIADEEILAFDAFNLSCDENKEEKIRMMETLLNFYGTKKWSIFKDNVDSAAPLFIVPDDVNQSASYFLEDFNLSLGRQEQKRNEEVLSMTKDGKLPTLSVDNYKCEHPIPPNHIYEDMFSSHEQYRQIMQVFKLSLLMPPSTADLEGSQSSS